MKSGIYQIKNKLNGKVYIGQAEDIRLRWIEHRHDLKKGKHVNRHLQAAYIKYGIDAFEWSVLERCSVKELDKREVYWIEQTGAFKNGYNMTSGGGGIRGFYDIHGTSVVCIETGNEYPSIATAARETGISAACISECCRFTAKSARGTHWRYSDMPLQEWERMHSEKYDHPDPKSIPVICIDTGTIYESVNAASKAMGVSKTAIANVCKGKTRMSAGYRWKYLDTCEDDYRQIQTALSEKADSWKARRSEMLRSDAHRIRVSKQTKERWKDPESRSAFEKGLRKSAENKKRPVVALETGMIYPSVSCAAQMIGATRSSHIVSCCTGKRKTAYGYHWAYANEG